MTDQRDLKRRVRERMAKTGESYTTARQHILDQRPTPPSSAFDVVEPVDLTEPAAALGFKCLVMMFPSLAARINTTAALMKVRDVLLATVDDPATWQLRATVFRGELPPRRPTRMSETNLELGRFVRRAMAGLGGVSEGGTMLALQIESEMVVCILSTRRHPSGVGDPEPMIWLHAVTESLGTLRVAGVFIR